MTPLRPTGPRRQKRPCSPGAYNARSGEVTGERGKTNKARFRLGQVLSKERLQIRQADRKEIRGYPELGVLSNEVTFRLGFE